MDYNKLLGKTQQSKIINPIEIFNNLDKESDKVYLWPGQKTVLDLWLEKHRLKKDTIIKLHTGQGKTLIGLLMLQSLLNEGKGPALYLCPDNTLVKQTVNQAEEFGIKIVEVASGTTALPREFLNNEAILVTNCKKLFNGKSVFGVEGTGREIRKVGAIVIDDAHRCLEIIRDSFSIRSKKYIKTGDGSNTLNPVFSEFFNLFSDSLKKQSLGKYDDIVQERDEISLTVPYWVWQDKITDVMRIISEHKDSWDIKFSWDLIKEQLEYCYCIFSGTRVEIVPRLVPINLIPSFSEAKHRIFLSATLTEDAFLIKDLDIDPESVSNPLTDQDLKYSGERLIILPTLVDPSLKREELITWFTNLPKKYGSFGFFTIVPSGYHARFWKGATVITTDNFEDLLDSLKEKIKTKKAFDYYLLLNKYDGIDLPSHTCRILCLDSLPSYDALIDRYNQSAMPNSTIIQRKLAQRIEQGVGRAIRGVNDYCVVIIIGTDISGFFSENTKREYLSNEAQQQIKIGELLAKELKKEGDALTAIENQIQDVISRKQGWKDLYKEEMKDVGIKPIDTIYIKRLILERTAEVYFQKRQIPQAISTLGQIIEEVKFDKNELGWYLQLKATYEYSTDQRKSLETQLSAFTTNTRLSRPPEGIQYAKLSKGNINRAQRIYDYIQLKGGFTPLILEVENILDKLVFGVVSDLFEEGIDDLGKILGFETNRPEQVEGFGPDNVWQINDDHFWIIECKNCVVSNRGISKAEAEQLDSSIAWFEKKYEECHYVPIMIHPSNNLMKEAFPLKQHFAIRERELENLKHNVKKFYKSFSGVPINSITPDGIKTKIKEYSLDSAEILASFSRISK